LSEKIRLTVEKVRMNEVPAFERYIGVDYSWAETPASSLRGLRAYSVSRTAQAAEWLRRADQDGSVSSYLNLQLEERDRKAAEIEGWILGVAGHIHIPS